MLFGRINLIKTILDYKYYSITKMTCQALTTEIFSVDWAGGRKTTVDKKKGEPKLPNFSASFRVRRGMRIPA